MYATAHIILIQFTASMYVFSCLDKSIICKGISYPRYEDIILPRYALSHERCVVLRCLQGFCACGVGLLNDVFFARRPH